MSLTHHVSEQILKTKSEEDINRILKSQEECLKGYKETEKKIEAFNKFSKARYVDIYQQLEQHAKLLKQTRKDMNSVFTKLGRIKKRLNEKYPEAYAHAVLQHPPLVIDSDEE
ncbi:hypothetical protein BY458DRAFT_540564 [Sporodiniella umbellata]|nr:hypothetical protein BY458DRAFT_540564 [Sporodiniella umbellata]